MRPPEMEKTRYKRHGGVERDRKGKTTEDELESDRWRDGEKDTETEKDTGKETKT